MPSPWAEVMSTKTLLASVCKTWHHVAVPFIYEDVVFHRPRQIAALARTLTDDPALCPFVRRLKIDCNVPLRYQNAVEQSLSFIYGACPNIYKLSYNLSYFAMTRLWYQPRMDIVPFQPHPNIMDGIVEWECGGASGWCVVYSGREPEAQWLDVGGLLSFTLFPNLLSLTLHCLLIPTDCLPKGIRLQRLTDLRLLDVHQSGDTSYFRPLLTWHLPRLGRLIVPCSAQQEPSDKALDDDFSDFLNRHGENIWSLDLSGRPLSSRVIAGHSVPTSIVAGAVEACPALKHVVLTDSSQAEILFLSEAYGHIHFDNWVSHDVFCRASESFTPSQPSWGTIAKKPGMNLRLLDRSIRHYIPNILRTFPPRRLSSQAMARDGYQTIFHRVGRLRMIENVWCLARNEDWEIYSEIHPDWDWDKQEELEDQLLQEEKELRAKEREERKLREKQMQEQGAHEQPEPEQEQDIFSGPEDPEVEQATIEGLLSVDCDEIRPHKYPVTNEMYMMRYDCI
ncbi:hypothetical protein K474DRAFT_1203448 [Panus rudis PR-1116 ss-1]|nr:hypothetical protein K474DRAFT_1203448 [Panus rudis PR-1116 ss-1]